MRTLARVGEADVDDPAEVGERAACVLRMNAVTLTTVASFGSDGKPLAGFGAMSTTTSSPNAPAAN